MVAPVDHKSDPVEPVLSVVLSPWQMLTEGAGTITGTGGITFTKTEDVVCVKQTPAVAVMVNVVVCATGLLLFKDPEIGVPDPLTLIPAIFVLLSLDHVKKVPATPVPFVSVRTILVMGNPVHIAWVRGDTATFGVGFTVTVKETGIETQDARVVVTVKVVV